jgi:hypothetical protein
MMKLALVRQLLRNTKYKITEVGGVWRKGE